MSRVLILTDHIEKRNIYHDIRLIDTLLLCAELQMKNSNLPMHCM